MPNSRFPSCPVSPREPASLTFHFSHVASGHQHPFFRLFSRVWVVTQTRQGSRPLCARNHLPGAQRLRAAALGRQLLPLTCGFVLESPREARPRGHRSPERRLLALAGVDHPPSTQLVEELEEMGALGTEVDGMGPAGAEPLPPSGGNSKAQVSCAHVSDGGRWAPPLGATLVPVNMAPTTHPPLTRSASQPVGDRSH